MTFNRDDLNNPDKAFKQLVIVMQDAAPKLQAAGVEIPNLSLLLRNTAEKISKMGVKGPMDEEKLNQFLKTMLIMELKPELGKKLGVDTFNLEMARIEKLLISTLSNLEPNDPKSMESLKGDIANLLKANPAFANIPAPDLDHIASEMAQRLSEKYARPKPEPESKNEKEEELEREKRLEEERENKLSLLDLTNLALVGFLIGKGREGRAVSADLTINKVGNTIGAVSQNADKNSNSFLDIQDKIITFKKEQALDNTPPHIHTPLSTRPKPPGVQ